MSSFPIATPSPPASSGNKQVRRRNRIINSCLECRKRKLRCTRGNPCEACARYQRNCVFLDGALDAVGLHKLTEIKNQVGNLEDLLASEVAVRARRPGSQGASTPTRPSALGGIGDGAKGIKEEEFPLSMTAIPEVAYENDVDDELSDLGLQIGMLRINERIGGLYRSHLTLEFDRSLREESGGMSRFSPRPPASPYPIERTIPSANLFSWSTTLSNPLSQLPTQQEASLLYAQYWACVDPMAHILHKPTFELEYRKFWEDISQGTPIPPSTTALIYSVFFAAAVSLPQAVAHLQFNLPKQALLDKFRVMAEHALMKANFLRTARMETLQAFTIYLIPQCRNEISRSHSALVAALIRLAESMSLHRDDEQTGFQFTPLERQGRRSLWHMVCFLDLKTTEIHGPKPAIRQDEFDTKLPLNVDDASFESLEHEPAPVKGWTNMTFSLIRYECYEAHRFVFRERIRPTMSPAHIREVLERKSRHIEEEYLQYLDESNPVQKCAKTVARLLLARLDPMVLQRYIKPDLSEAEPRLKNTLIQSGLEIMENAMLLETSEELAPWAWYAGAYQQYHCILFVITEVQRFPNSPYADRIWRIMDYVFGAAPNISREERAHDIVVFLKDKLDQFINLRSPKSRQLSLDISTQTRIQPSPIQASVHPPAPHQPQQWCSTNPFSGVPPTASLQQGPRPPPGAGQQMDGLQFMPAAPQPVHNVGENWILPGLAQVSGPGHHPTQGPTIDWVSCGYRFIPTTEY
ncbi:hypothetical protein EX30DRAFT_308084 [Ascodesmis nigricans]|uniref:Zn(2)-C6 fungal-type domain-containing protein n=1 Tax=Ascodesmis nigricans TaxID=341454 RepID=A0A4S2MU81_9PEZI|nr:hypothetical protein EX30DRAFT_308084 [Ascodesmis nigricans]